MIMHAVLLASRGWRVVCDTETRKSALFFKRRETSVVLPVPEAAEMMKILPFLWGFMMSVPMGLSVDCSIRGV